MEKSVYRSIPDTSDTDYWEATPYDPLTRTRSFVPKDKELHRQLKRQAKQEKLSRSAPAGQRNFDYKLPVTGTLPKSS